MMRWDIINYYINNRNFKNYLEIGYYKGWSFDRVECNAKLAIDPNPSKTIEQQYLKYNEFDKNVLKLTSDDFFEINTHKFDIIFIDGLHESNQVYKDITNSLSVLNPSGVIVLHDCNPPTIEHTTTGVDGCWTGDVYKAVLKYQKNYNHLFYTVNTDWGVGVIDTSKEKENIIDISEYDKGIEDWNYFSDNRNILLNLKDSVI